MILKIAWKNIWRSKGRSFVVMGSMAVGVWALIFGVGFMNGFMVSYSADVINHDISNFQIHHPEFKQDRALRFTIPDGQQKANEIRAWEGVKGVTTRTLVDGMVASARKASGVQIRGVEKSNEAIVTGLDSLTKVGAYFQGIRKNPILIGKKLAESLDVEVKSKVVLTFNDSNGNITSAAFRVAGILESSSLNISEGYAFVLQSDLTRLLGMDDRAIHEIAVLTHQQVDENLLVNRYTSEYPNDLAETWGELAPELAFLQQAYENMLYILMVIIMLALVFGLVNTMLMAVLERIRELGMLMAVGMTKLRVFVMVLIETILLGIAGAPIGMLLGWLTIHYFSQSGVDLSAYSEGLEAYGYDSMLYPYLEEQSYIVITISVFITAFVGAIYPSWKAVKLRPVEALHSI